MRVKNAASASIFAFIQYKTIEYRNKCPLTICVSVREREVGEGVRELTLRARIEFLCELLRSSTI